jgi:hypothetical protein
VLATFFTFAWIALCFTIFRCADIGATCAIHVYFTPLIVEPFIYFQF